MQSTLQTFNNKNFAIVNSSQQEFLAQEKPAQMTVLDCSVEIRQEDIDRRDKQTEFDHLKNITCRLSKSKRLLTGLDYQKQNRYKNILAFEETVVKLNLFQPLSAKNYINANFVKNKFSKKAPLILTQGPKSKTATKFWQMLETHQCQTVVAILNKKEIGSKCFKYWPEKMMDSNVYLIETIANGETQIFEYKKFKVLNKDTAQVFYIDHFLITAWQDHGVLKPCFFQKFIKFLHFLNDKRAKINSPMVIHCSAGIGRSGTLAASLFLEECQSKSLKKNQPFYFSVFDTVRLIREQRYKAVQNIAQYTFLYELTKNFQLNFSNSFYATTFFLYFFKYFFYQSTNFSSYQVTFVDHNNVYLQRFQYYLNVTAENILLIKKLL